MNVPETMNEVLDMSDDEGTTVSWGGRRGDEWLALCCFQKKAFTDVFGGMLKCCAAVLGMSIFMPFCCHLNHAVRKANAPEKLSDGEYISDVEEGIYTSMLWWDLTPHLQLSYLSSQQ